MNQLLDEVHFFMKDIRAKKSLGQNFLIDQETIDKTIESADITDQDTILEIGPGLGFLSRALINSPARQVILVEKDDYLASHLKNIYKQQKTKIIHDDALLIVGQLIVKPPFKVVSNLPYNISSPVLISLLTVSPTLPEEIVVMLQKEVADRIVAKPGDSNRGLLTVFIELFGKAEIVTNVSNDKFYPSPKVQSAVVKISEIKSLPFDPKKAFKFIKLAFAGKRKKIKNSLFSTLRFDKNQIDQICLSVGITADLRPEDLNRENWIKLIEELKN